MRYTVCLLCCLAPVSAGAAPFVVAGYGLRLEPAREGGAEVVAIVEGGLAASTELEVGQVIVRVGTTDTPTREDVRRELLEAWSELCGPEGENFRFSVVMRDGHASFYKHRICPITVTVTASEQKLSGAMATVSLEGIELTPEGEEPVAIPWADVSEFSYVEPEIPEKWEGENPPSPAGSLMTWVLGTAGGIAGCTGGLAIANAAGMDVRQDGYWGLIGALAAGAVAGGALGVGIAYLVITPAERARDRGSVYGLTVGWTF